MISKIIDIRDGKYYLNGNLITDKDFLKLLSKIRKDVKDEKLFAGLGGYDKAMENLINIDNSAAIFEDAELRDDGLYVKLKILDTIEGKILKDILKGLDVHNNPMGCEHVGIGIASRAIGNTIEYITSMPLRILNWFWLTKFIREKSKRINNFFKGYTTLKVVDVKLLGYDIVSRSSTSKPHTILREN